MTNYLRGRHRERDVSVNDVKLAIVEVEFVLDKHNLTDEYFHCFELNK